MLVKSKKKKKLKKWLPFYVMALPCVIYMFINNYMPMVGLQIAFKDYKVSDGVWGSKFIGLKNFEFLFKSNEAWIITRNTIGYNLFWIFLNTVLGLAVAIFLNEVRKKGTKKIYQTLILLPYLISMVVVSYLVYAFLSEQTGLINHVLEGMGMKSIAWYQEAKYWPVILTIVYEWKSIGFNTIIFLASLVGIDKELFEAAAIDGASKWKQIKKITVPMMMPTIIMVVTMGMGNIFRSDFGLFYQVPKNQGLLNATTNTIDTFVFRALMQTGDIGMSSAAAFYQSVVCLITILVFNGIVRRLNKESAMF